MGFQPRRTNTGSFDRVTFPLSETVMTLESIKAFWSGPSEWKPDGNLTFLMVWKDAEGDEHTEFPSAPKAFGYNEKSTFWNRIAALAGKTALEDEDLTHFDLEIPGLEGFDPDNDGDPVAYFVAHSLQDHNGRYLVDQNVRNVKVPIGVSYKGASLIGKQCRLVMGEKRNKKGELQEGNKVAQNGALPLATGGGGKKKSGTTAPPPVAQAEASAAMP
jgi:hypothetical protein